MGRLGQGCTACEVASEQVRGAKCAKHASSTSPALTTLRDDHRRGELGPVRYVLAGGDPARLEAMRRKRTSRSRNELGDQWYPAADTSIDGAPLKPLVSLDVATEGAGFTIHRVKFAGLDSGAKQGPSW